jgi:hypothetical protein
MKTIRSSAFSVLVAALMCIALNASALTVGRLKGSALLGQPLEVVASLELGQDEDVSTVCAQAVVAYGEAQQPAGQTAVKLVPSPQSQTVLAFITSTGFVNEPVVNIDLNVGCAQKTTRRFVLLSEFVGETASRSPSAVAAAIAAAALQRAAPLNSVSPNSQVPPVVGAALSRQIASNEKLRSQHAGKSPKAASKAIALGKSAGGTVAQSAPAGLPLGAVEDLKRRIDAVADWQAAKLSARDSQPQSESIDVLQQSVKVLQTVTLKNQKSIEAVSGAIDTSESRYLSPSVLYTLFGLVALVIVGLGYSIVSNVRPGGTSSAPWWGANSGASASPIKSTSTSIAESSAGQVQLANKSLSGSDAHPGVDIEVGESAFAGLAPVAALQTHTSSGLEPKRTDKRDFAPSGSATLRAINTKEMFDVRQQADFFMALGQHDEAIRVLEQSNSESEESNPLVLLDLLKILHTLSRRTEFDRYRSEFNLLFTGIVPQYASFLNEGNGLEKYPEIVQQIVKLWSSDDAMDFIEQCMVRAPEDEPTEGFDLEAFRDLLILHGILRRIDNFEIDSGLMPFSTNRTMSGTLTSEAAESGFDAVAPGNSNMAPLAIPPPHSEGAPDLPDLDLDLTNNHAGNLIDFDVNEISGFDKPNA